MGFLPGGKHLLSGESQDRRVNEIDEIVKITVLALRLRDGDPCHLSFLLDDAEVPITEPADPNANKRAKRAACIQRGDILDLDQ